jgi:uncharacterized repeat protein (TIGR03803 family)
MTRFLLRGIVPALAFGLVLGAHAAKAGSIKILHAFCSGALVSDCSAGANPQTGLLRDKAGSLYGTAFYGGLPGCPDNRGCGTIFRFDPDRTLTVLHAFTGGDDGGSPQGTLFPDGSGNLYGTTLNGGQGHGVLFKLAPDGSETVLHTFSGADHGPPAGGVIRDAAGDLYGVGLGGKGAVYELTPDGQLHVLHVFCSEPDCSDGENPNADLVADESGNLYGTTKYGGTGGVVSAGTLFEVTSDGKEKVLWNFCSQSACDDGEFPSAGLIRDGSGNLYGTTEYGGAVGTIFRLAPDGAETALYHFQGHSDGLNPQTRLAMGADGTLYGTTLNTIFSLAPDGTLAPLAQVNYASALVVDNRSNLYGTLPGGYIRGGDVFELRP